MRDTFNYNGEFTARIKDLEETKSLLEVSFQYVCEKEWLNALSKAEVGRSMGEAEYSSMRKNTS